MASKCATRDTSLPVSRKTIPITDIIGAIKSKNATLTEQMLTRMIFPESQSRPETVACPKFNLDGVQTIDTLNLASKLYAIAHRAIASTHAIHNTLATKSAFNTSKLISTKFQDLLARAQPKSRCIDKHKDLDDPLSYPLYVKDILKEIAPERSDTDFNIKLFAQVWCIVIIAANIVLAKIQLPGLSANYIEQIVQEIAKNSDESVIVSLLVNNQPYTQNLLRNWTDTIRALLIDMNMIIKIPEMGNVLS